MKLNILIGGKAGQGINKVSEIVSQILVDNGYFTFNYRDYQSLIRGGHNFNVLCFSDNRVGSIMSQLDVLVALDEKTVELHKPNLKKDGLIINSKGFEDCGLNLNIALAGALTKVLGINEESLIKHVKKEFNNETTINAAKKGFGSQEKKFDIKRLNNKIKITTGSQAVAQGAIDSGINLHLAYPMTPATGVMHHLATKQIENNLIVFQPENEIAVVNAALGASFAGAKVLIGTSGGGYDLMSEGLSMQGMTGLPLVFYLASRPGPGTGIPTYSMQGDLDIALRGGHGEFPRVVIAPGDPIECVEKTNEAFYLAEKFGVLSIILSDKHLAESEFSFDRKPNKTLPVKVTRKVAGEGTIKVSSYEHDDFGNKTENAITAKKNAEKRVEKYKDIQKECKKFEMMKIFGNKDSKNLVIGWGSSKTTILDAIDGGNFKFLQVIYMKPMSDEIKKEIEKAEKVILVEQNVTGQLGRLIREKTGLKIENRILRYDGRPFTCDGLKKSLMEVVGK